MFADRMVEIPKLFQGVSIQRWPNGVEAIRLIEGLVAPNRNQTGQHQTHLAPPEGDVTTLPLLR